jgi:hypothetical protein
MTCMLVVTLFLMGWKRAKKKERSFVAALVYHLRTVDTFWKCTRTTILNPSITSPKSRAAFTRVRAFAVVNFLSKSIMASIHGSPTLVSSIVVAREGGIMMSESKLDSGRSILCTDIYINASGVGKRNQYAPSCFLACFLYLYFYPAVQISGLLLQQDPSEMSIGKIRDYPRVKHLTAVAQ